MVQDRKLRNKPKHLWSTYLWQKRQEHKMGNSLFSKHCWETWTAACKSMKLEHTLTPCTKINSKWLKDLNIRQDTIKLLEENIGKTFSDIDLTNVFLSQSPKSTEIKTKPKKPMGPIQTYKLCTAKENIKKKQKQKYNLGNERK